jgi:hypothetical protein
LLELNGLNELFMQWQMLKGTGRVWVICNLNTKMIVNFYWHIQWLLTSRWEF